MKKIIFATALIFSCMLFKQADAQLRISLGFNIGSQPDWGPVGYDHADYYYMPDIDAYYDVPAHQYVYYQNNVWIRSAGLPPRYSNYNVYNGYKVVINGQRNPWERNNVYRARYARYKGRRDQAIIRNSNEEKYRNHWNDNNGRGNDQGRGNDRRDNGPGRDNGRGNDGKNNGRGNGRGHDKN
ncbi:MAG: hypothetical protein ABI367_07625 [Mucilaginibacter sp.]